MNKENHGVAFARALANSGLTKSAFARELGVSPQSVQNWERRGCPARHAVAAGALLSADPSEISFIERTTALSLAPQSDRLVVLNRFLESGEQDGDRILDTAALPHPHDEGFILEVQSDAMAGRIEKGDTVVVCTNRHPRPGNLAVVRDPRGALIIRVYSEIDTKGTFSLAPESPHYPTITSTEDEGDYELIGIACALFRAL